MQTMITSQGDLSFETYFNLTCVRGGIVWHHGSADKHIIMIIINHHCHHNLWDLLWIINLEWAILQPITPPVKPSLIHVKPFQCEGNLMIIIFSLLFVKERGSLTDGTPESTNHCLIMATIIISLIATISLVINNLITTSFYHQQMTIPCQSLSDHQ